MQKNPEIVLPYETKFVRTGEIPELFANALHPKDKVLHKKAAKSHQSRLHAAISNGELKQISPISNIPTTRYLKQGVVTVSDLYKYAAQFHIRVSTSNYGWEEKLREFYPDYRFSEPNAVQSNPVKGVGGIHSVKDGEHAHETEALAALFDPVPVSALEKMFPAQNKWKNWAERAARNGLKAARSGRGFFNPYQAAEWFLKKGVADWDLARCNRALANNLPPRSIDRKYLLTGDLPE